MFVVRVYDTFNKDCLFSSEAFQIADLIRVLEYPLACRFQNVVAAFCRVPGCCMIDIV